MEQNKKRWLALVMAISMLAALLPDSFLSTVRAWAENTEKSATLTFSANESLNGSGFSFTLYELTDTDAEYENKDKELTSTDGWYLLPVLEKEAGADTPSEQGRAGENTITADMKEDSGKIVVELKGLVENSKYVYELIDKQNNYFTCANWIDTADESGLSKEETLKAFGTGEKKINLSIAQNASADSIDVNYNVFPVIKTGEHIFPKRKVKNGQIQQVGAAGSAQSTGIELADIGIYDNYRAEFYTENNQISEKTVDIEYNSSANGYQLTDGGSSVTLESNKIDISLQLDFSGEEMGGEIKGSAALYAYEEDNGKYSETPAVQTGSPVNLAEKVSLGTLDLPFASKYKLKVTMSDENSRYKTNQEFLGVTLIEADINAPENGTGNRIYILSGYKLEQKKALSEEKLSITVEKKDGDGNTKVDLANPQINFNDKLVVSAEYQENDGVKYNIILKLEYYDSENSQWKEAVKENGYYTIEQVANYKITAEIANTDSIQGISKTVEFSSNPLASSLNFTDKVEVRTDGTETKNIVGIQAKTSDLKLEINGSDYISQKVPEDALLTCSIPGSQAGNASLECNTENNYILSIPGYFTGEIPVVYRLEKKGYQTVEKTVYFNVFYEEISKADTVKLPDAQNKVYSNQVQAGKDYRPIITAENTNYTFYARQKNGSQEKTGLSASDMPLTDGVIELPDNSAGTVYYDIYGVNDNGEIYRSELSLNIDTKNFTITVSYEDDAVVTGEDGKNYYQGRKASISFDKDKSDASIDKESFQKDPKQLINSITYGNDIISGSSLEISDTAADGWYQATNKEKAPVYKISEWDKENGCYHVLFEQDGIYKMNDKSGFTDSYGNPATIQFTGNDAAEFILDHTAPAADCKIQIRKYTDGDIPLIPVSKVSEFLTTSLGQAHIPVKTSLENIHDIVSGVTKAECIVTDSPIQRDDLESRKDWADSVSSAEGKEYTIQTVIDNTNQANSFCTVTFTDKEVSKKYYVYYKVSDRAGNVNFFNELGFVLDNKAPEIYAFEYMDTEGKKATGEINKEVYFNQNVSAVFKVTDENLQIDESGAVKGIKTSINGAEIKDIKWSQSGNHTAAASYSFALDKNEIKSYKIKIECEDKVGIPAAAHEETLILDGQSPVIQDYEFYGTDDSLIEIVKEEKENNLRVLSVIGKNVNTDVKVKLQIAEEHFDKGLAGITVIDSSGQPVSVSLDSAEWKTNNGIYENFITLVKKEKEEAIYKITVTCKDKAGNESSHTETLVIDKKAPAVSIQYQENSKGEAYYKSRSAVVSVEEAYSLNQEAFKEAILAAVQAEPELADNKGLKISGWDEKNHCYTIEFTGNTKYTINKIAYIDDSGNSAGEIEFTPDTEHGTEFYIDKIEPTAEAQLVLYQFGSPDPYTEKLDIHARPSYLSAFFENSGKSQFILYNIQDNLTGIEAVEYCLSRNPIDINHISDVVWYSSGNQSPEGEEVVLAEGNGPKTLTVSLPEPESSSVYYIYYRITDKTGNVSLINGAGITLDQEEPVISGFEYQNPEGVLRADLSEDGGTAIHAFSDNITVRMTVEEEHFDTEKSMITVEKYQKSGGDKGAYQQILEKKDWVLQDGSAAVYTAEISLAEKDMFTENGEANQYKITVTAKDKVGRGSVHSEIVRIDREKPVITIEYDDSNKIEDHYYKEKRTATISVQKTFQSSVSEIEFKKSIENGITVKDEKNQKVEDKKKAFYDISGWDAVNQRYIVHYGKDANGNNKDAVYEFSLDFADKLKNPAVVSYHPDTNDGNSFVIDREGPQVKVSYTDTAKAADYYHAGKRTAELEITDLSFTYAYHYDKSKNILNGDKLNEDFISLNITAENPFNGQPNSQLLPAKPIWKYDNGVFKAAISYEKEAVYTFGVNGKDICQKQVNINYTDNKGNIKDGESFVIDSSIPVITVTYDDKNKKTDDYQNGYYQGTRAAEIEVKDLSLYYAKTTDSPAQQEYPLTKEYIEWKIEAKDIQNNDIQQAYTSSAPDETGWIFDKDVSVFKRTIVYNEDAIYNFSISGGDICGNKERGKGAEILYKRLKDGKTEDITDGESFVIDTQAPVITVVYNDENKLKDENGLIDHYYQDTRTATVTVSDLSFAYASRKAGIKESDAITDKKKINWAVSAKDEKGENMENAYLRPDKWEFSEQNGTYAQEIEFTEEAIYEFSLSGHDLCQNAVETDEVDYQAADGNSFLIDRTAPKVTIKYNDANKQTDRYYKAERTAEITVSDLSYVYEELRAKADGNSEPELTASRRIPISITAENALNREVLEAYTDGAWTFSDGSYKKTIIFDKDAIYHFEILKEKEKEDVLKESAADIYGRTADIFYINQSGITVTDYDSFVISREVPRVTVTYNDNAQNKQADYYYKNTRTAEITVSDLSYVYEDIFNQNKQDGLVINHADRMNITVTAEDTKGILAGFEGVSEEAWSFDRNEEAGGVYKKTIVFDGDAIYSLELSGKNIFEREAEIIYQNEQGETIKDGTSFVIDREAPVITVTYDNTNKKTEYYQNHFYAGKRTAVIEISDLSYVYEDRQRAEQNNSVYITADRVKSEITAVNESGTNLENTYTESGWSFDKALGIYRDVIEFSEDAIYSYSMQANDIYGNSIKGEPEENTIAVNYQANNGTAVTDYASFVIDASAPKVTVTYDDWNKGTNTAKQEYTNGYYKDSRTANITVSDLSLIYADKYMPEKADTENLVLNETDDDTNTYILPVIRAYSNDIETDVENAHTMNPASLWSWNEAQNGYQAGITFTAEADYSFEITGEDICKNIANVSYSDVADANRFVIDKTAPTISITYNDNTPVRTIDGRAYFAHTRTATIIITEGCDTFDREDALNNIIITAKDAAGNNVEAGTYTVSGWTESKASANGTATRYTADITYRGNANYTFEISYMDKTGHTAADINTNGSAAPYTFTVDSGAPTGSVSVSGFGSWNRLAELVTFERWSNSTVNITASADDAISSVYSVKYYKTAAVTAMTREQLLNLSDSLWTDYREFSVKPDEMFSIYLRVEDRSGNISFISSDGIIVDATAPSEENIAPEITVAPVQPVNNIYNTDVTVDITVTDPIVNGSYSGLKNIRYEVQNMGAVTQQGQLYTFSYTAGQTLQPQLLQRWNGQIVVDRSLNNSNDVRIIVYAQDNSNNTSSAYTDIQIDVTQPSIDITYDNNNGDASFGTATYFNADRTATISITERNFNADDVQITITNTDGAIPSVSGWSSSAGTGNGDDTVHTATITYSADGDYVFAISYTDLAGNMNTAVDYGNSAAPEQFTIDKTVPVINVTYDNNSVQNNNYYNEVRTATVSITEHNFDAGRYSITLTASDDGTDKAAPSIGGWSSSGDIHTTSVQFTDDGYYTMNMSYTDMAGNQAVQFVQQTFYVDKTVPRVTVKGVKNNTANNKETIGFEITCTDTNFDVFTPQLSVTKMVNGKNVTENCEMDQITPVRNGQTYIVNNLDQDGIYSLTCTARDKAGNVFNRVVYLNDANQEEDGADASEGISFLNFSVNRSGSVYTLDSYADEVAKYYYVREVDENLVIVETNVNTLDSYIELNGKKLEEGTDYQTEISGGNGEWYVVRYIIQKELFEKEGEYKIVVHSKDYAGNTAYSDTRGANMAFVIDKTAPTVTVSGIETNGRYQVEKQTVTLIPKDDGGRLQKIKIEAFGKNGDKLEGFPISYEGEELLTLLEENNGELSFELPQGTGMRVRISCEDSVGNEMDVISFDNIVVSTSKLTIILSDKRVIYGIIAGVLALAAAITLAVVWKKRRKEETDKGGGEK